MGIMMTTQTESLDEILNLFYAGKLCIKFDIKNIEHIDCPDFKNQFGLHINGFIDDVMPYHIPKTSKMVYVAFDPFNRIFEISINEPNMYIATPSDINNICKPSMKDIEELLG